MPYLYLMRTPELPMRTKIGYTKHLPSNKKRANGIAYTMDAKIIVVFYVELWGAYFWEQTLHKVFWILKAEAWGSGKDEWFWFVRTISIVIFCLLWLFEWALLIANFALIIYLFIKYFL